MASSKAGSYTVPERSNGPYTVPERSKGSHTAPERSKGSHTAPERSEGSHTAPASSDKGYDHLCGPCSMDGVDKDAKHYCRDCIQNICDTCKVYHRKFAGTKNHTISLVNIGLATVSRKLGYMNISSDDAAEMSDGSYTVPERSNDSHTAPERSKDSHTAPASYDKGHDPLCGPCSMDGVDKDAKHYCRDCRQNICGTCKDYHRKFAGTKNHTISLINMGLATVSGKLGNMNISSDDAATKAVLLGRKAQSRSRVNVKARDDEVTPYITGCTVMANGDAVLCDNSNEKIKLLNSSGVITGNMELSSEPWDVSVLDPSSVIVTLPYNKQLQMIQVYPQLKPGRVIQLDKKDTMDCWGVEVGKGELYVTCRNITGEGEGEIRVLSLDGKVKRRLGVNQYGSFMFTSPYYITVNSSGEKIFVSDYTKHTVTCMSVDGRVIYTYTDDSMRDPRGLLCDSEDNILVCGTDSNTVQVLTADGKRYCTLLTASDGVKDPCSIAYRDSDNTLLLGCYSDHLLSFHLTK